MNRFIVIEPDKCIGCGTCLAACSETHEKAGKQSEPRLSLTSAKQVSAAVTCHHCEGAPCSIVCPVNAIEVVDNSIRVCEQTCIGCKLCGIACPFGAIHPSGTSIAGVAGIRYPTPTYPASMSHLLRWEIGVYTCAVKCDLCAHDPKSLPHCVSACLTKALKLVDDRSIKEEDRKKKIAAAEASESMMRGQSSIVRRGQ